MKGIFCGYFDEEMEQDVPLQPTLDEAILFFIKIHWDNEKASSAMKAIVFQVPDYDDTSLQISSLEKKRVRVSKSI